MFDRSGLARDTQGSTSLACAPSPRRCSTTLGSVVAALAVPYLIGHEKPDHDRIILSKRRVQCPMRSAIGL